MESGIVSFDPNDLISYSPEESEDEGEPSSAPPRPPTEQALLPPGKSEVNQIDLAAISGEEIQITVPSVSASVIQTRSPPQGARFKCKFCPAYTHTAEDFIKHFIMHFGRNRISYKQMTHDEVRALPNAKEKFVCGICARCFETRDEVKDHMINDHGFNEDKPREKPETAASASPTVVSAKRKLDDDFVDSQKIPLSDSSSCPSVQEGSIDQPSTKSSAIPVSQANISGPSTGTVVLPAPSSSVVAKSEIASTTSTQQQQQPLQQSGQTQLTTISHIQKVNETEDAELNEFLQPMSLKTLKLKLLAGLKLKCPQKGCVYKFETRAKRDVHLKCHNVEPALIGPGGPIPAGGATGKEEKKDNFKCYQCGIEFPRWRECSQHLWKQHQVDVNMLKCPVCDVRFEFAVKVYRHLQTHRPVKAFSCPSCSKSFATQSHLSVHEMLHKKQRMKQKSGQASGADEANSDIATNAENEADAEDEDEDASNQEGKPTEKLPWYAERKCDICGHMFSTSKILSKHIKTVHHKIKPFICSVCGYKSARKVTLTIHMRQHSGQKPLECKECPFRTADPSTLKYHEKRHSKDKWYECKFCGLLTIQASALKTHIRSNHPKEYESMKCDLCNFSSVNAELLARHKSDHKAGLIKSEDSRDSVSSKRSKNAPESSSDCFLPIESTDSVVHDAGGFTIPAVINAPVAHSEETQFPT